ETGHLLLESGLADDALAIGAQKLLEFEIAAHISPPLKIVVCVELRRRYCASGASVNGGWNRLRWRAESLAFSPRSRRNFLGTPYPSISLCFQVLNEPERSVLLFCDAF